MAHKRTKPVAMCTECGEVRTNPSAIGVSHIKTKFGQKCKGVFGSMLGESDWEDCPTCQATGMDSDQNACPQCNRDDYIPNR